MLMKVENRAFGTTKTGQKATIYSMENTNGMKVEVSDFGALIVRLFVPDQEGTLADVVLGFDTLEGYETNKAHHGAFIGRHANRIGNAVFTLNGTEYKLDQNDGTNNLHSGFHQYAVCMYQTEIIEEEDSVGIAFSRVSPHMEQGFPGNLTMTITYTLTEDNALTIDYHAVSDEDTIVNFTNHSYFNLAGEGSGSILDHKVWINASKFTPTTKDLIPTGELREVVGTPLDFTTLKRLGEEIEKDYEPLKIAGGYDHNFVLDNKSKEVELAAKVVEETTKRTMEVYTDLPGIQLYTGNFLKGEEVGKHGTAYGFREGVCFETQFFPNSCNIEHFPSCVLKAGEEYHHVTVYKFV